MTYSDSWCDLMRKRATVGLLMHLNYYRKLTDCLAARSDSSSSCSLSILLSASSACSCSDLIFFFTASRYAVPDITDCLNCYHTGRNCDPVKQVVHPDSQPETSNALPNTGSQSFYAVLSYFKTTALATRSVSKLHEKYHCVSCIMTRMNTAINKGHY